MSTPLPSQPPAPPARGTISRTARSIFGGGGDHTGAAVEAPPLVAPPVAPSSADAAPSVDVATIPRDGLPIDSSTQKMTKWGVALSLADWRKAIAHGRTISAPGEYEPLWAAVELGLVTEDQALMAIANDRRLEVMPTQEITVLRPDDQAWQFARLEDLMHARVLPYELRDGTLRVLVCDPADPLAAEMLRTLAKKGATVKPRIGPARLITRKLQELSRRTGSTDTMTVAALQEVDGGLRTSRGSMSMLGANAQEESAVIQFVDDLVATAVDAGASDLHVEPLPDGLSVRIRVDGRLREIQRLTPNASLSEKMVQQLRRAVVNRFFRMAERQEGKASYEPVDATFTWKNAATGKKVADVRFVAYGTTYGGSEGAIAITMRFLSTANRHETLEACGFEPSLRRAIRAASSRKEGIIVNSGPTGSGKSTTMHAILADIYREELNVITIEDPVERRVPGYRQLEVRGVTGVNGEYDASYPKLLRAAMRMDPDIILVGEIRDKESADAAVAAANTGHLVLSTLHANTALLGVERLLHFDVEPFLVSQSVTLLLAQRLVSRLCQRCSKPTRDASEVEKVKHLLAQYGYDPLMTWADAGLTAADLEDGLAILRADQRVGFLESIPDPNSPIVLYPGLRHPKHCDHCESTGYYGRVAVFSVVSVNEELRQLMMEPRLGNRTLGAQMKEAAFNNGTRSLFANGLLRVLRGDAALGRIVAELGPGYSATGPL